MSRCAARAAGRDLSGAGAGGARLYHQERFPGGCAGLSGGIDSALTLAIAADAIGADKVQAVMMPFRYTAQMSVEDAKESRLSAWGGEFNIIPSSPCSKVLAQLAPLFEGTARDTTEENPRRAAAVCC